MAAESIAVIAPYAAQVRLLRDKLPISGLEIDSAFDRGFRDIHAVTQQLQGRQAHFETVGQFMLGIEPDTTFL